MKLTAAQIVVETLKAEGITNVFGVSGSPTLPILDVIYDEPQIRYIQAQHELNAMYMANGYARATRGAGICLVSPGPGITHCVSGVGVAYYTSTPSLLIASEETTKFHNLGISLHHDLDAVAILKPVTKLSLRVERADRIAQSLQMAFRTALSGRKGPVYLGIAKNLLRDQTEVEVVEVEVPPPQRYRVEMVPPAEPKFISRAADLLVDSERPVVMAGGGLAWAQAQDVLLELAELLGIPVAATSENRGLIPGDHPLALSTPTAAETMQDADVLLAVGCSFDEFTTNGFGHEVVLREAKIIQVDIDPTEIGKIYPVEVGVVGDARSVLHDLLHEIRNRKVDRRPVERLPRIKELLRKKREWQESTLSQRTSGKVPIQRFRLFHDLRQALPRDAIVAGASGGTGGWFGHAFEHLTYSYGIGSWHPLGAEYPEALGVKVALPERVVVCVTGDGSMMECLQEIATAVAYDISVLCVVCHNGVFGNMRDTQLKLLGERFIGTDLPIPNLANIAREFGAYGERVGEPDEIIPAVGRALESGKPALLEVMMDISPENLRPPSGRTRRWITRGAQRS
ncbi:thiamine pyrophosphate-binding protein [Chloroflexota bacterium]